MVVSWVDGVVLSQVLGSNAGHSAPTPTQSPRGQDRCCGSFQSTLWHLCRGRWTCPWTATGQSSAPQRSWRTATSPGNPPWSGPGAGLGWADPRVRPRARPSCCLPVPPAASGCALPGAPGARSPRPLPALRAPALLTLTPCSLHRELSHPRTMQCAAPLMRTCTPQNTCRGEGAFRQRPAQQQPTKEGPRPLGLLPKGGHPKSLVAGGGFVCLALAQSRSPCPSLPECEWVHDSTREELLLSTGVEALTPDLPDSWDVLQCSTSKD